MHFGWTLPNADYKVLVKRKQVYIRRVLALCFDSWRHHWPTKGPQDQESPWLWLLSQRSATVPEVPLCNVQSPTAESPGWQISRICPHHTSHIAVQYFCYLVGQLTTSNQPMATNDKQCNITPCVSCFVTHTKNMWWNLAKLYIWWQCKTNTKYEQLCTFGQVCNHSKKCC